MGTGYYARSVQSSELIHPLVFSPRTPSDICWLAGLLEGEGCFRIDGRNNISIALTMADEDIVRRAASILRFPRSIGKVIYDHPNYKDQYRIIVQGNFAAQWMMTLYPVMGQRRRAKIKECLDIWRSCRWKIKYRAMCPKGHRYDSSYVARDKGHAGQTITVCRTCVAQRQREYRARQKLSSMEC
jgi:hypothetical protein